MVVVVSGPVVVVVSLSVVLVTGVVVLVVSSVVAVVDVPVVEVVEVGSEVLPLAVMPSEPPVGMSPLALVVTGPPVSGLWVVEPVDSLSVAVDEVLLAEPQARIVAERRGKPYARMMAAYPVLAVDVARLDAITPVRTTSGATVSCCQWRAAKDDDDARCRLHDEAHCPSPSARGSADSRRPNGRDACPCASAGHAMLP
ncbi:hypothetical protein [Nannocystis pusilla]|uniref:hypothetical protein n=1 Tax=Nannocystis pusilla TaxID=889268 RepID=UPI003B7B44B5